MKAKKIAILLVSASLTMGTVGAMTVLADPPATGSEALQIPEVEAPQVPEVEAPQLPDGELSRFVNWNRNYIKKPQERPSAKHHKSITKKKKKKWY